MTLIKLSPRRQKELSSKLWKIATFIALFLATVSMISIKGAKAASSAANFGGHEIVIGIDLGTTESVLGYTYDGKTTIIPNDQGNRLTPSIAAFTDTEILIGDPAYNQMTQNARNTLFGVKRFIGRSFDDPTVQKDMKLLPFEVINKHNKPYFRVSYKGEMHEFTAEEISGLVLKKLKETAEAYLGVKVTKAVITVPAYFDDTQKQATKDAGTIAGLDVVRIINEPTSAAMAYGIDSDTSSNKEKKVVVYDLGGGTFDVSLLNLDDGIFEVEATGGDTHLGGQDFDENIVKFMIKQFKKKFHVDITSDERAVSKLRKECEKAKRALSSATQTKIEIENLYDGIDFSEILTRARFEDLNMHLFKETLKPLKQILIDGNIAKNEIDEIVLVGGSTRIPKIQELVQKFFNGKELNRGVNPDEAVAHGAAIQAALIGGHFGDKSDKYLVLDVTPLSLGIETVGEVMTKIIDRGTKFPVSKSQVFSTHQDNQDSVLIKIYQGERAQTKHNRFLGKFMLQGIPAQPRGVPQIEVRFEIDANGLLQVEAFEKSMGEENRKSLTIKRDSHNLRQDEIDKIIEDFEQFKADDKVFVDRTNAKNRFESTVFGLKSKLIDKKDEMDEDDYDRLMSLCEDMSEWILDNADSAEYDDFIEKQEEFDEIVKDVFGQYDNSNSNSHGYAGNDDDYQDHEDL